MERGRGSNRPQSKAISACPLGDKRVKNLTSAALGTQLIGWRGLQDGRVGCLVP